MIARLDLTPSGYFAAQASQVGSSDEEIAAFGRNEVPPERVRALAGRLQFAASSLHNTIPQGSC